MSRMATAPHTVRRDATALISGTVVYGLSIYGVAAVGTRAYGAAAFAPISVLWTFWAVAAAVLTFPLQHWVIHRIEVDGHEGGVRASLPAVGAATVSLAAVLGITAWLGREQLFGDDRFLWAMLVFLLTLSAALMGVVRGLLAGRRRFIATAATMASENLTRLMVAVVVVVLDGSVAAYGLSLLSGIIVVAAWPSVFDLHGPKLRVPVAGYLAGLAGGTVLAQIALTSGPAVLSAIGGSAAAVTGLFVTMALFRAPYLMSLGLANMVTAPLSALAASGRRQTLLGLVVRTVVATLALATLGGVVAFALGPSVVELIFGQGTAPSRLVVALVAAGSAVALGTLGVTLLAVARGSTGPIAGWWLVAFVVATLVVANFSDQPVTAVAGGFLAAQTVAFLGQAASQLHN